MIKRIWIISGSIILLGVGLWLGLRWYANKDERIEFTEAELVKARQALGQEPIQVTFKPEPLPSSRQVRLALGGLGLRSDSANGQAADLLVARLNGTRGIEIIERQALEKVLNELSLSLSGLVRAKDAVRAGKLLRADWFLLGSPLQLQGTNYIVVRIVDARTGIMRDTAMTPTDRPPAALAQDLATFVRKCRQDAVVAQAPVFLAIGAFDDLSLNNRLAGFPTELRSYLAAAYRGGSVTLLEREHAQTLLQELRLDLAGLTENGGTNGAVMQAAVWLLTGDYQTYDNFGSQVEVALQLERMFGRRVRLTPVRQAPGEKLFGAIKAALDKELNQTQQFVFLSRVSEARAQMLRGRELTESNPMDSFGEPYQELTEQEARAQQRKLSEAIRAFSTVLLLEPTNREAKVYLGDCYCRRVIHRLDEGRSLLREVLEEPVQDKSFDMAAASLVGSFAWTSSEERLNYFSRAEQETGNTNVQALCHNQAAAAREQLLLGQGAQAQPEALAQNKLRADLRSAQNVLEGKSGTLGGDFGMDDYIYFFGGDKSKGARKLAEFLPQLVSEFPQMAPHLTAVALGLQRETNNPVLEQFKIRMEECRAHPEKVLALNHFWSRARYSAYPWCLEHGQAALATSILEGMQQAAAFTNRVSFNDEDRLALAFGYKASQHWKEALVIFESYSNLPVQMGSSGPWGRAFQPVLTSAETAFCREKLGMPRQTDPREFEMGTNCLCMHNPSSFTTDPDGLWVAIGNQLIRLDYGLGTNLVMTLPISPGTSVNCLAIGSSNLWVGTDGEGLVEIDKQSRSAVRYSESQGLMSDVVNSLFPAGDSLWIGYGVKNGPGGYIVSRTQGGGLGQLDLARRQFRSFTPSLALGTDALRNPQLGGEANGPTRRIVSGLTEGPNGDIWFSASGLRRFRPSENAWDSFREIGYCTAVAVDSQRLAAATFSNPSGQPHHGPPGISILSFADQTWTHVNDFGVLPTGVVSTMTFEDGALWAAGMGFIAKISPQQNKLLNYAYIPAHVVDKIQIGGGFVWTQFDRHLHRAKLP